MNSPLPNFSEEQERGAVSTSMRSVGPLRGAEGQPIAFRLRPKYSWIAPSKENMERIWKRLRSCKDVDLRCQKKNRAGCGWQLDYIRRRVADVKNFTWKDSVRDKRPASGSADALAPGNKAKVLRKPSRVTT